LNARQVITLVSAKRFLFANNDLDTRARGLIAIKRKLVGRGICDELLHLTKSRGSNPATVFQRS
jgi:hypothetical protein